MMKHIPTILSLLMLLVILLSCNQGPGPNVSELPEFGWRAVYQHDTSGNPISGSIDSLIAGIRNGYDLKVGWGVEAERDDAIIQIEHVAKPLFLTIIQEKDVSIVIDAHPLLQSYWQIDQQQFREGGHIWQCVLNTTGTFNAQLYNRSTGELMRDWPQKHRMTWFLEYPNRSLPNEAPLFD